LSAIPQQAEVSYRCASFIFYVDPFGSFFFTRLPEQHTFRGGRLFLLRQHCPHLPIGYRPRVPTLGLLSDRSTPVLYGLPSIFFHLYNSSSLRLFSAFLVFEDWPAVNISCFTPEVLFSSGHLEQAACYLIPSLPYYLPYHEVNPFFPRAGKFPSPLATFPALDFDIF